MSNSQVSSSPVILPSSSQSLQLLSSDQSCVHKHHQDHLYQNQPYQQQGQLDDMTREFLMQDVTGDPAQTSQPLLQIPHASSSSSSPDVLDEELNIYDYIHAKQEEEDDDEHDQDHILNHEHGPDPDSLSTNLVSQDNVARFSPSADLNPANAPHHTMRRSPVSTVPSPVLSAHSSSSPTFSALSPSPSLSSNVQFYNHHSSPEAVVAVPGTFASKDEDQVQDSDILGTIQIKQECLDSTSLLDHHHHHHHHSNYMDTSSIDLYDSTDSSLLSSQSGLMPPPQDLFRVLMEELQTQASIQREKFFSATTGSGTGMDSVEFLFNGPQTQEQASSTQSQLQLQRPVPQFMKETAAASPDMFSTSFKLGSTDQESSGLESISESSSTVQIDNPSAAPLDYTRAPQSHVSTDLSSDYNDDINMEIADPEGDMPSSPIESSSSSGSVTPESTSPTLHPTFACSSLSSLVRSSPKAEVVRVAFTRFAGQRFKPSDSEVTTPQPSKSARKDSLPSIVSSITELSFKSAMEQHNVRRRASGSVKEESLCPSIITMQPAPRKKRKLSRDSNGRSPNESPRLGALPSPPSSVRTTPPMQPTMMDATSSVESLALPPAHNAKDSGSIDIDQPITPTSPLLPKGVIKLESLSSDNIINSVTSGTDIKQVESVAMNSTSDNTKGLLNANNKRSWTSEEESLLLKLVESRTPIKDIAETLNRSVHSVRSRRQVLTDPGFVKGNGHAQPRRSKPDPSSKLPTYSQMAFLSLARLPELQGTLNDVASMVEKLFSRHLNRIPRTGHKNLQIWRAQISDALAHEKGHPRPRFESFGVKRGRQWVYRLTNFGKGVMNAMGSVDQICEDLLKNNEMAGGGTNCGPDGEISSAGGAGAGLGQGNGYGYSYCPEAVHKTTDATNTPSSPKASDTSSELGEETNVDNLAASNAIANAMAAMAAGLAAMTAAEDEKSAAAASAASHVLAVVPGATATVTTVAAASKKSDASTCKVQVKEKTGRTASTAARSGRKTIKA
ncbi:hypothetical protein BGX27_006751 [Mortierella sp. AM989]|nr:hypothetical protein BGX27_006751 [Mortierella sp. AM989]